MRHVRKSFLILGLMVLMTFMARMWPRQGTKELGATAVSLAPPVAVVDGAPTAAVPASDQEMGWEVATAMEPLFESIRQVGERQGIASVMAFEPTGWEPDVKRAFTVADDETLVRRSEVFRIADFHEGLVRVDRVERVQQLAQGAESPQVLWQNAMMATQLLVQVQPEVSEAKLLAMLPDGHRLKARMLSGDAYVIEIPNVGVHSIERALAVWQKKQPLVVHAEPNFLSTGAATVPNDPGYAGAAPGPQWHLPKIQAPVTWDIIREPRNAQEANSVVVAVLDTGVDFTHPDLAANMWSNPNEVAGNNLDDDGNGFRDDVRGWDFADNDANPMDDVGHGTHVAGILGAIGNNGLGGSGVCWQVKILPLRIIRKTAAGTLGTYSAAVNAMQYLKALNDNGRQVAVANHSWGGAGYSKLMLDAINNPVATKDPLPVGLKGTVPLKSNEVIITGTAVEIQKVRSGMTVTGVGIPAGTLVTVVRGDRFLMSAQPTKALSKLAIAFSNPVRPRPYGVIHVAAAGNKRQNNDLIPTYPACTPSGFIISVGASDQNDLPAVWAPAGSNIGPQTVDLFAPGSGVWSTYWKASATPAPPGYVAVSGSSTQGYLARNGTSMATPLVSGAAALLTMWQPEVKDARSVRQIILDHVEPVAGLVGKCASGGRLNMARMLDKLYQPLLVDSGGSTGGAGTSTGALSMGLSLSGQVAKGDAFTLAIKEGQVLAWGWGYYGQVPGAESAAAQGYASATPVVVPNSEDAVMVAATGNTAFMIKSDGSVWAWGGNSDGLLATGGVDLLPHPVPVLVSGLGTEASPGPQAAWISAGGVSGSSHVMVVNVDGSVWTWGRNARGQLGDGSQTDRFTPVQVTGLTDVVMAAAGSRYSVAMQSDGRLWRWGHRIGRVETDAPQLTPIEVPGLANCSYIAAGHQTAYAVLKNGQLWWWGSFDGDDTQTGYPKTSEAPVQYVELEEMVAVSAGLGFAIGVDVIGRVFSWGRNEVGQLGTGVPYSTNRPQEVTGLGEDGVGAMATGRESAVVLLSGGELLAWGRNLRGELGDGRLDESLLPVQVPGIAGATLARAGRTPAAAIRLQTGSWMAWGFTGAGPLSQMPAGYTAATGFVDLQPAWHRSFVVALRSNGTLAAWGDSNQWGEFGNNMIGLANPALPPGPATAVPVQNVSGVVSYAVSPGWHATPPGSPEGPLETSQHCLAVNADGTVRAWGRNHRGQLGDGSTTTRSRPVAVPGLTGVVMVAAGGAHSLALRNDGSVWSWGANHHAQLGDGTTTNRSSPVQVVGLTEVVQIRAAGEANVALKADGSVWVWGLGGSVTSPVAAGPVVLTATQVPGLPAMRRIEAGPDVVMGLDAQGNVWGWSLYKGLLGRFADSALSASTPAPVEGISQITDLSIGIGGILAVRVDGTVWAWGNGENGFLGDGSAWSITPQFVLGFGATTETLLSTLGSGNAANSWLLKYFTQAEDLRNPAITDDTADPEGDRLANLLEYALDLDPTAISTENIPQPVVERISAEAESESAGEMGLFATSTADLEPNKDYLGLSIPRNGIRRDVQYIVEVSSDLTNWRSGDPHTLAVANTSELLKVFSTTPINVTSPQLTPQFIRLRIARRVVGGVSVTGPAFGADLQEVKQAAFVVGSSIATEADGSLAVKLRMHPAPTTALTLPLTLAGSALNGIGKDYTTGLTNVTFSPGQEEATFTIQILQDIIPEPTKSIQLTLGKPAGLISVALGLPLVHAITLLDDETRPRVLLQPQPQLLARGSALNLASGFTASPPPTLQWLRNGAAVGGARAATYSLLKADLAQAGTYTLRAVNPLGTVLSESVAVGVVDPVSKTLDFKPGASTTITVATAGPGLLHRWHRDGAPMSDGNGFVGTSSPSLKITGMQPAQSGLYHCVVTMGALTRSSGTYTLRVMDQKPEILKPVVLTPNEVVIGSSYGPVALAINPALNLGVIGYSQKGLPTGLKMDPLTGLISGRPTVVQSLPNTVTFSARNLVSTDSATASLYVRPLPPTMAGSYDGFVSRHPSVNSGLGGRVSLTVLPTGAFSGRLTHEYLSQSFAGSLETAVNSEFGTATVPITLPNKTALTLVFTIDSAHQEFVNSFVIKSGQKAEIQAWRQHGGQPVNPFPGYYTAALTLPSPASPQHPLGTGYASLTIAPTGLLTVSGKLADGIPFTTGGFVGAQGKVLVHQALAATDTVLGCLVLKAGSAPLYLDNSLEGSLTWSRVSKLTERLYPDGFAAQTVLCFGGRYVEPSPVATALFMGLTGGVGNARLIFGAADYATPPVRPDIVLEIQAKGVVKPPAVLDNPRKTTLTVTPKTGFFRGGMTFSDANPIVVTTVKLSRSAAFEGFVVREPDGDLRGHGFFLLEDLPSAAKPKNTARISSWVLLAPAAASTSGAGGLRPPDVGMEEVETLALPTSP